MGEVMVRSVAEAVTATSTVATTGGQRLTVVRIGGYEYPDVVRRHDCNTCQSDYVEAIEAAIVGQVGYTEIARRLPEGHEVSVTSITNHAHEHMPWRAVMHRILNDRRQKAKGFDIEAMEGIVVDRLAALEEVSTRALQKMWDGDYEPTLDDGFKAMALALKIEQMGDGGGSEAAYREGIGKIMSVARSVMSEEQLEEFMRRMGAEVVQVAEAEAVIDLPSSEVIYD